MKICILMVALLSASIVFGQSQPKTIENLQKTAETFKKKDKYKIEYNKFEDKTLIVADNFMMTSFKVAAGFFFDGKELKTSPKLFLRLTAYAQGQNWRFAKGSELILLADDVRINLGDGFSDKSFGKGMFGESVSKEVLVYQLQVEHLKTMANAKTIEFQIGKEQAKFNNDMLEMFRNLYVLISDVDEIVK